MRTEQLRRELARRELAKRQPMIGPPTGRERPIASIDFREKRVGLDDLVVKFARAVTPDIEGSLREGDPLGGMVDGPAHAVTQFVVKGVPSKVLRAKGTQEFVRRAKAMFPESLHGALDEFARKFPRTVAHAELTEQPWVDDVQGVTRWQPRERAATRETTLGRQLDPGKTRIPIELMEPRRSAEDLSTLTHEIGHVAQALGSDRTPTMYSLAQQFTEAKAQDAGARSSAAQDLAYRVNPYEQSARSIARRKVEGSTEPPVSAPRLLSDLVQSTVEKDFDRLGRRRYVVVKSR